MDIVWRPFASPPSRIQPYSSPVSEGMYAAFGSNMSVFPSLQLASADAQVSRILHCGSSAGGRERLHPKANGDFDAQYSADVAFVAALKGLRPSGGLWRLREAECRLEAVRSGAARQIAVHRATHALCEMYWRGQVWVPACQFDMAKGQLRPEMKRHAPRFATNLASTEIVAWLGTSLGCDGCATPGELWVNDRRAFERLLQDRATSLMSLLRQAA